MRVLDRPQLPAYWKAKPWGVRIRYTPELELEGRVDGLPGCGVDEVETILGRRDRPWEQPDGVLGVWNRPDEDGLVASAELPGLDL